MNSYLMELIYCNQVSKKLEELAEKTTENTEFLQNHAQKVAKFAVELLDQVHTKEEANIKDEDGDGDRYGSLFSEITRKAIIYGQKKVRYCFAFANSQNQCLILYFHTCTRRLTIET